MAKKAKNITSGAGDFDKISPKPTVSSNLSDPGAGHPNLENTVSDLKTSSVFLPEILPYGFLKAKLVLEADQVTYQTRDGMVVLAAASADDMLKKLNDLALL